ncbi:MAG: PDGLE domain-containing protein [Spirochaetes bacterium]|nr:PDGLE domain-containing protein [Spirochaetota bacterium]
MKTQRKLLIGLGVLALLSPLGFLLPEKLHAGAAWGEWSAEEVKSLVGYVPRGLAKLSTVWDAWIPDYAFKGWENRGHAPRSLATIASAILGIALCIGLGWVLGIFLKKKP